MVTARTAIHDFYAAERLPTDGGVSDWWVWVYAFGLPVPIPNTRQRVDLVPYHDLHHIVTGYRTDEAGEAEVAAWCLGSGGGPLLGQLYDLGAFLIGMVRYRDRTTKAFYRGRQGRNLYRRPAAEWMDWDLSALRAEANVNPAPGHLTPMDRVALARTVMEASAIYAAPLLVLGMLALTLAL